MSVYTPVTAEELEAWLTRYAVGGLVLQTPIATGIENTNYFVTTAKGRFVLTLYERLPANELHARLTGKAGLLVLLDDRIDRAAIDAGESLKIIANVAVGYDNLDVAHGASKGIVLTNTPDVLTDATADFTWALILAVTGVSSRAPPSVTRRPSTAAA